MQRVQIIRRMAHLCDELITATCTLNEDTLRAGVRAVINEALRQSQYPPLTDSPAETVIGDAESIKAALGSLRGSWHLLREESELLDPTTKSPS